jgi:hypothetical protein
MLAVVRMVFSKTMWGGSGGEDDNHVVVVVVVEEEGDEAIVIDDICFLYKKIRCMIFNILKYIAHLYTILSSTNTSKTIQKNVIPLMILSLLVSYFS